MERGVGVNPADLRRRAKKVQVVEQAIQVSDQEENEPSIAPQLSVEGREELEKRLEELQKYAQTQETWLDSQTQEIQVKQSNVDKPVRNRRHSPEFNKHKSSQAMGQLLRADENVIKRQRVITGATV